MKKKILKSILFLTLAMASTQNIVADNCCCCCDNVENQESAAEKLLNAVEGNHTLKEAEQFFNIVVKQFCMIGKNLEAYQLFFKMARTATAFVKIIKKHEPIFEKYLNLLPQFKARNNSEWHCKSKECCNLILDEILIDKVTGQKIVAFTEKKLLSIPNFIVKKILEKRPESTLLFAQKISENPKKYSYILINTVFKKMPAGKEKNKMLTALKNVTVKGGLFKNFIKQKVAYFLLKKKIGPFKDKIEPQTQSEYHLYEHQQKIERNFPKEIKKNKKVRRVFKKLHTVEKREQKKGRYTFVHAQPWVLHFFEDIFHKLWKINYREKISEYKFIRFESKNYNAAKEIKKRKQALEGTDNYRWRWGNNQCAGRLFVNHAIFGNTGWNGECSIWYWLQNHDHGNTFGITTQSLFAKLGLKKLYKKCAQKLEKLRELHKSITKYGNMLLISLTAKQLAKCVIAVDPGGQKRTVKVNDKKTDDIKLIMDTLRNNPELIKDDTNFLQYTVILTHDCALDPINGPRIYSFNAPDKKKMKEYEQLRDEIFVEIERDFEKKKPENKKKIFGKIVDVIKKRWPLNKLAAI